MRLISSIRLWALGSCTLTFIIFVYISSTNNSSQQIDPNDDSIQICISQTESICQWLPKNLDDLKDPRTGFYDLSIQIKVREDLELTQYLNSYYDYLYKRHQGTRLKGSYFKRLVQMDQESRVSGSVNNYHLYPQVINMEATVDAVKECRPVKQFPINNPKLQVLRSPTNACSPKKFLNSQPVQSYPVDLIVVIKSCVDCLEQRQRIRSTFLKQHLWLDFEIRFVFVTGLPAGKNNLANLFKLNASHSGFDSFNKQVLETRRLLNESNYFEDLLIGNFYDTYNNLTLKQIFTFHWISVFCQDQAQLFLFLDDDHSLVPYNLIKFIRTIPNQMKPYFAGGSSYQPQKVIRPQSDKPNKYAIGEDEFPWSIYVPYPTGAGYLLGSKVVQDLAIASRFTEPFRLEDVYLGILLFKLKHTLIKIPEMLVPAEVLDINSKVISALADQLDSKVDWKYGKVMHFKI